MYYVVCVCVCVNTGESACASNYPLPIKQVVYSVHERRRAVKWSGVRNTDHFKNGNWSLITLHVSFSASLEKQPEVFLVPNFPMS